MISPHDARLPRRPAEVFAPGEFLREELEARGWTQLDLADILGRPPRVVNEVIMAKRSISPETAKELAAALGTSAEFWMRLDASYQLWKRRDGDLSVISRRARLYRYAPVREMLRRGWLQSTRDLQHLEQQVCAFFGVQHLGEEPALLAPAARKSTSYALPYTPVQRAWLRRAQQLASEAQAGPFAARRLPGGLLQLKQLARTTEDIAQVPRVLAQLGIRLVIVEPLPNSRIDGACFWLGETPVIALSLRFNRIDNFWFVLFHELAHVRQRDVLAVDADAEVVAGQVGRPSFEAQADAFATQQLIPTQMLEAFITQVGPSYSSEALEAFALKVGVHPGVVVGQLQYRGEIAWAQFRRLLVPVREIVISGAVTDGWGTHPRLGVLSGRAHGDH